MKLCKKRHHDEDLNVICNLYHSDFDKEQICIQLQLLHDVDLDVLTADRAMNIFHVKEYFLSLSQGQWLLMSQVVVLLQFILVIQATNVTSERSFSALRCLKSYLGEILDNSVQLGVMLTEKYNRKILIFIDVVLNRKSFPLCNLKRI